MPPLLVGAGPSRRSPVYNSSSNPPIVADPLDPNGGTAPGSPSGLGSAGSFTGDASAFLNALYAARPKFVKQQGSLLEQLGPSLRSAVFQANPELATASQYLQQTYNDPFGGSRSTFEDALRTAQAARGFTGGGSGVAGEEARYLTNYAERRRQELLPQLTSFGNNILQISGLQGPPNLELSSIGALALQNRNAIDSKAAAEKQSQAAQKLFDLYASGGPGGAGSVPATNSLQQLTGNYGRRTSVTVGGGGAAGSGTPDFFARASAPYQSAPSSVPPNLEQLRLLYAAGLLGNVDPVLKYGTGGGGPAAILGSGGDAFFSV